MLTDHRRAFVWSVVLLAAAIGVLLVVGRTGQSLAPRTDVAFVGELDSAIWTEVAEVRVAPLTWLFHALNVIGSGLLTIPLRAVGSIILAVHRRWRAFTAFVLTWATSEMAVRVLKDVFDRGRPSGSLVETTGPSFP